MKPTGQSALGVLVDCFMRAMHRYDAGRTLPILHAARLTTPQIAVLEFTREPQTVSAVATYLGLSGPATSQLTDKLVREHLVRRMQGTRDRRERIVVLSAKGKSLIDRIAGLYDNRCDNMSIVVRSCPLGFPRIYPDLFLGLKT